MSTWEIIAARTKELPLELQLQVLAFLNSLTQARPPRTLKSPAGLWADLGIDVGPEDIAQARQELWANFPGETP